MSKPVCKPVYKAKPNARIKGDPQAIGEALQSIRDKRGKLTPADVVDEARPVDSVLHPELEWDDFVAGEAYRREQSRTLIQVITVEYENEGQEEPTELRAFVSVVVAGENTYESTAVALGDIDLRRQVIHGYALRVAQLRREMEKLEDFSDVLDALGIAESRLNEKLAF